MQIQLKPLTDGQWNAVIDAWRRKRSFLRSSHGEMPTEVEQVFSAVGVPLFPPFVNDLVTDCRARIGKPLQAYSAAYFLLGERFDADPFCSSSCAGRDQGEITAALESGGQAHRKQGRT